MLNLSQTELMKSLDSSYAKNNLWIDLYSLVKDKKPFKIIDFGVLNGYSTIAMALALKEIGAGKVYGYDLWEKYPYKHATKEQAWENIIKAGVEDFVELAEKDFYTWEDEHFDLLHLDISNDGEIIDQLALKTELRRNQGAVVVFEGGSEERDQVEWMKKYHKKPINEAHAPYLVLNNNFPSLSRLI
jgi:predicted O-methyltransferase YrrM